MESELIATKDNYITSSNPTLCTPTITSIRIGEDNDSVRILRALIQFDLSGIPFDATIVSAVLSMYRWFEKSDHTRTMRVFRIKRDWEETETSWNEFSTGNSWETAGCGGSNDREQTDIGYLSLDSSTLGWFDFQLDNSKVQELLTGGVFQNNGFLLKNDTELDDSSKFYSSNYDEDTSRRLKLTIEYSTPNPEPDPVGYKFIGNVPDIMEYHASVRIRAARRDTFLRTKKKGGV